MALWDKKKNFVVLGALVVLHLFLISIQVPLGGRKTFFEKSVFFFWSPVERLTASAVRGVKSLWSGYVDLRRVRNDNQKLRRELFFLTQENRLLADRVESLAAGTQLRESLSRFRANLIAARVVGMDAGNYYRSLVIDKGSLDGVRKDMAVCDRLGSLVGRTIEPVSLKTAAVQLITDQDSSVSVIIEADRTAGILSGNSGMLCDLKYVVTTAPGGREGDELVTTGFDRIYPAGLRVGRIVRVQSSASIFKVIRVQPYWSFSSIDAVAVLPPAEGAK